MAITTVDMPMVMNGYVRNINVQQTCDLEPMRVWTTQYESLTKGLQSAEILTSRCHGP